MPVIKFEIAELERLLGKHVPRDQLAKDIPQIGADVEDAKGDTWAIEFFPDRPDLFTVEGIARAMRAWYGFTPGLRSYDTRSSGTHVTADATVAGVRPFVQAAFVRGIRVTEARLQALIDLQEDLHWGLGARRRRVAIGIHDAAVVKGPFRYTTTGKREHVFVPLGETVSMEPQEILQKHAKGVEYAHLLAGQDRYPIILDASDHVVSMPPIINAARTIVTTSTRDVLLDVTGTDEWAVSRALNMIATALAESGGHIETIEIREARQPPRTLVTPDLAPERRTLAVKDANGLLGTHFTSDQVAGHLERMGFGATPNGAGEVRVLVPAYRADVLHDWDVIEDVAIGHGIKNFTPMALRTPTTGAQLEESRVSDRARKSLVGLGFLEAMSLTLSNPRDQFVRMQRPVAHAVEVKNPVTEDHTMLRVSLLPGLMTILKRNAHRDLPQRLFEVGMVSHVKRKAEAEAEAEVTHERRIAGVMIQGRSNFSEVKGVAQALARDLGWGALDITKAEDPAFIAGRCAGLTSDGHHRGVLGEVHPGVLDAFGLAHPVMAFEFHLARGPGEKVRGATDQAQKHE